LYFCLEVELYSSSFLPINVSVPLITRFTDILQSDGILFHCFLFICFYFEIDFNESNDRKEQILRLLSNILFADFVLLSTVSSDNNNNSTSSSSSSSSNVNNNSLPSPLYNALNKLGIIINKLSSESKGSFFF
jgi:hypothetical protein